MKKTFVNFRKDVILHKRKIQFGQIVSACHWENWRLIQRRKVESLECLQRKRMDQQKNWKNLKTQQNENQ